MPGLAFMIGALIPTGLLSLLFIWMPGRYLASNILARALVANGLALIVATLIGGMGLQESGDGYFRFWVAFWAYLWPQVICLAVWIYVLHARRKAKVSETR